MKNIAVGKKLLIGFGAVVAMIAVILALTVVTSLTRNNDLQQVTQMTTLQQEANQMLNNFNLARVEIRSVFSSIEAEDEYNLAMDYLAKCEEDLNSMRALSAELGGYKAEEIEALAEKFARVESGLINVGDNDEMAIAAIERMGVNGLQMTNSSSEMFEIVSRVIIDMGEADPSWALDRVESVVLPVKAMNDVVEVVRVASRELMLDQNLDVVDELYSNLDDIVQRSTVIRTTLTSDEAKVATDNVLAAVEGYKEAIAETVAIIENSDREIADTRVVFGELSTAVTDYVIAIASDATLLNEKTVSTSQVTMYILIAVGAAAALFSVLVAVFLARAITGPLNKMKMIAIQAGTTGDLVFSEDVRADVLKEAEAKDELGQSLKAFATFVDRMIYIGDCLEKVSNKDLTVEVGLLSEKDTMGNYINNMVGSLNEIFADINGISTQVATAANEIAIGAQSLAQGSTEQASTVEEISASISEINGQMNTSNETALKAAQQSTNMSHIAEIGNEKMQHMTGAMHEINDASQSIGQVIKAIDDIAFQTNILALNAAVEAARAGVHGKGFAVVADEVRSLASKSAEAAKETAALISANIEKTEQGLSYTQETAENLTQIMQGIAETSESLQTVAEQSESAKAATAQVTLAVDQVSQVVQQNSAASEESAAASEEMSSQAQMLQQLIAEFKLKGHRGSGHVSEPQAAEPKATAPQYDADDKYGDMDLF